MTDYIDIDIDNSTAVDATNTRYEYHQYHTYNARNATKRYCS